MRRRRYLAAGGSLAAAVAGGVETIERELTDRLRGSVQDADGLEVRIRETNAPIEGGRRLEVMGEVENGTARDARPEIEFLVDGEVRSSITATVEAGETETLEHLSHRTYPVAEDGDVTVRLETEEDADEVTVDVLAPGGLDPAQTRPDQEITVESGTTVHFEVESDALGEYGGGTQWFVDGEYAGWSMGPWYSTYYSHRGADFWRTTFESPGTREVTAAVAGDDETHRTTWTVEVTDDGTAAPTVEATDPPEGTLEVTRGEPIDLELEVAHPDGALDRVVWWLGHADVVLDTTDVSGTEDTAAIELDSACHGCPVVTWVCGEHGTVTSEQPWVIDEVDDEGDGDVTIVETNDPVDTGDVLEVTARVENATDSEISRDVELIVGYDPERVDSETVTVAGGETESVDLEFETATVRRTQTFPARVETEDDADERTVEAIGTEDVGLDVTITDTNAPVETGEFLDVTAELENPHGSTITREPQLVVGHDPDVVDTTVVTVEPGETETVTMGYETALVERAQEFPARVETRGDADEVPVFVYVDEPPLRVSIDRTNDPVTTGDVLEVTVDLENAAESSTTQDVELIVGHDPTLVDSASVTVDGRETESVDLEFETATVRRTQTFPVRVRGEDDAAVRDVEVIGTDDVDVDVTITGSNDPVGAGEVLEVTAEIENAGETAVTQDLEFVVGHDPTVEDSASVRLEPGETETVEMSFETAIVETDQEFPVRVESAIAGDERTVLVRGTDDEDLEIEFLDCTEAEVDGAFEDGDDVTVEKLFVDSAGIGNAHPGITVGDEVEAPFSGTVRVRVDGDDRSVDRTGDEVVVSLAEEGFGATIGSVIVNWFDPDERHETNPADCVDDRRPDRPSIELEGVDPGDDTLEVTFGYENPNDLEMAGGEFVSGTTPDEPGRLEPGTHSFTVAWTPADDDERLVWEIDLESYLHEETLRAETESAGEYRETEPELTVEILEATDPVQVEEDLEVTAELENVGDADASQEVTLAVDGQDVDTEAVELERGDIETVSLAYPTRSDDVGELEVAVRSEDDEATTQVTVEEPAEPATFEVSNVNAIGPVEAGEILEVTADVRNVGDESGETDVHLDLDQQSGVDSDTVSLEADESELVTLTYATSQADVGDLTATVRTDDDSESDSVTVTDPGPEDDPPEEDEPDGPPDDDPPDDDPPGEDPPDDDSPPEPPEDDPGDPPADDPPDDPGGGATDDPTQEPAGDPAEDSPPDETGDE